MKTLRLVLAVVVATTALLLPLNAQSAPADANPAPAQVTFQPIPSGEYALDPAHTTIAFAIEHLGINFVEGRFNDFEGTIHYNAEAPEKSSAEFTARVESIDTGIAPRDKHLRSADFFEVETHPEMTFRSTSISPQGEGSYLMEGDLTIKGVTRRISFPFTLTGAIVDSSGKTRIGAQATTSIDRRDFDITYGNVLAHGALDVGNEVEIRLRVEAIKAAPQS